MPGWFLSQASERGKSHVSPNHLADGATAATGALSRRTALADHETIRTGRKAAQLAFIGRHNLGERQGSKRRSARSAKWIDDALNRTGSFTERPFHELGSESLPPPQTAGPVGQRSSTTCRVTEPDTCFPACSAVSARTPHAVTIPPILPSSPRLPRADQHERSLLCDRPGRRSSSSAGPR